MNTTSPRGPSQGRVSCANMEMETEVGMALGEAQLSRLQTVLPTGVRTHASPARRVQGLTQGGAVGSCNTLYSSRGKGSIEPLNSLSRGWAIGLHLLNREDLFFKQTVLCTGPSPPARGCWRRHGRPASGGRRAPPPSFPGAPCSSSSLQPSKQQKKTGPSITHPGKLGSVTRGETRTSHT